jgi:ClpP class serine protease
MKDVDDQTLILADVARKALVQVQIMVRDLLMEHMTEDKASEIAVKLSTGTWTHDYAITVEEAKALGLPVTSEMPAEVYELMRLFPQPTRQRPSVEYVPIPYRRPQGP